MATKRTHNPKTRTPEHAISQIHAAADKIERRIKGETLDVVQSFSPSPKLIIGFAAAVAAAIGGFWLFSRFRSRRTELTEETRDNNTPNPIKTMLAGLLVQFISTGIETWGKNRARSATTNTTQTASND